MHFSVNSLFIGIDSALFPGRFLYMSAMAPFSPHRAPPSCGTFRLMISLVSAVNIVPQIKTLSFCIATVGLLCGCSAAPEAVYERLLSVSDNLVSYTFDDAIGAAEVITLTPGKEQEILISESDPVFDAGWTRSYFKILVMEGKPGRSYLVTVQSFCNYFGSPKTILSPYVIAFDDRGEVLAEGPVVMKPYHKEYTPDYHLEGKFVLLTGKQKRVYLLLFGDNRDVGSRPELWRNRSLERDEDGVFYETMTEIEVVSHPEGEVRLKVEEIE